MHSTTRAKVRDKAQRPSAIKSQPYIRLKQSTLELMHIWTSPDQPKEKRPHLKNMSCAFHHMMTVVTVFSLLHNWTSPDQPKEKMTTPERHVLCLSSHDECCDNVQSLEQHWKEGGCRSWRLLTLAVQLKWCFPGSAGSSLTKRPTEWDLKRRPTVSLYLNELLAWKL